MALLERGKFHHRPRNEPRFFGGAHPWIQIGEVESSHKYIRTWAQTLNDDGLAISKKFPRGTVLISIAATIGAVGILDFDCCVPDSIVGVTPRPDTEPEFLYHYLGYDREFRVHFLKSVCGATDLADDTMLQIEVQPHDHSDLAIKSETRHALVVVEFKVGADLQEKQSPRHEKAFFGTAGYGKLILEESAYKAFVNKTYVVLDEYKTFADGERRGLQWKSRSWSDIARDGGMAEGLWADLLDSLGELGVAAFQFQKLKNMNNAQHTKQAVAMHQTLSSIASRLKFGGSGGEDINWEGDEAWYGRNIPNRKLLGFLDLEVRVQAKGNIMGWFGYQSGPGHCERAVCFYCGSAERAQITLAFILERLRRGPPGRAEAKGADAWYQLDGYAGAGDAEWFDGVFGALADKKAPKTRS